MPIVSGQGGIGNIANGSIAISKLADPTTGKVIGSASNAAAAVLPPAFEWAYAQVTAPVNITDTAEATGTALISAPATVFDGAPVICEFFGLLRTGTASTFLIVSLFEGATQITELAEIILASAAQDVFPVLARYRFTPSAASHTYTIAAFVSATTGTPRINAGSGGTAGFPPAYVRFIKV